jgi:Putative polyhydroxyalkanoic acid system protein (PHA_gran_rgn)
MSEPVSIDLPHRLGVAEAKRRISANAGRIAGHLPAGAQVSSVWDGDRLKLEVAALGQRVEASVEVLDTVARITVLLPPALAFFGKAIEAGLRKTGGALLEDRSGR